MKADAEAVIERIIQVLGKKTAREMCDALKIHPSSVSRAKRTGKIPLDWYYKLENEHGIRRGYVENGEGDPHMPGLRSIPRDPSKKWATAIFSAGGQEEVQSEYPAAGIVTNASGVPLPIHHYAEYVLALEVRPRTKDGNLEATGSGLPVPRERLKRWSIPEANTRSLRTAESLVLFDVGQTDPLDGRVYVIDMGGMLLARRLVIGPRGPEFVPATGSGPAIPAGDACRIIGRVFLTCVET